MLEELQRQFVMMTPTVSNQYSVRSSNELDFSFKMNPTPLTRRIPLPGRYERQVGIDYEIAFAVKIRPLISEITFDLPHPDVQRKKFYFSNEYVPMWRYSTRYAHEIRQVLIHSPERKCKFYICQLLKDCVEESFSTVAKVMFYEMWNFNKKFTSARLLR